MPTGYTAAVQNGTITDLKPFALQCARGMGALILMRDEPMDAPIPEDGFKPSTYHVDKIEELKAERARLIALSDDETANAAVAEWEADKDSKARYLDNIIEQRERYRAMLAKARAWKNPPDGIREFMIEQLERSIEYDCPEDSTYYRELPPEPLSGAAWRKAKLAEIEKNLIYHGGEHGKDLARTESRNAWVAQLRASLEDLDGGSAA